MNETLLASLELMWKCMASIFIVMALLMGLVCLMIFLSKVKIKKKQ